MTNMDPSTTRTVLSQLADDLSWLEDHCKQRGGSLSEAALLRLAAAVVRNVVGPHLEGQAATPLHVVVVGGAGVGKSTVSNMLTGAALAETNPQAGFTRHPIAYTNANGQLTWPAHLGFLGPLRRLAEPRPANLDEDVYQIRKVPVEAGAESILGNFVVWDCPDMTTWAATGYVPRLIEVAGLADVVVYVASDERYNDEIPTQFLNMLLAAGKPVIACLLKMKEENVPKLMEHFKHEVVSRLPAPPVACLAVPELTAAQLADPVREASQYRMPILNQVSQLGEPPADARRRTIRSAANFLRTSQNQLLRTAQADLAALEAWRMLVRDGQFDFETRYRQEFLTSEKFHRFDEALVRLIELLELPGVGRVLSGALMVMRLPYQLIKGLFTKALKRPEGGHLPEQPVLDAALTGWLDLLRKEAVQRTGTHPLWTHVEAGFSAGLGTQVRPRFQEGFRDFQLNIGDEVERTARAIYEDLEKSPGALNTLRGAKFSVEVGAIIASVATVGLWGAVVGPLAASAAHHLVEFLGARYVDTKREQARSRQQALVHQFLARPLGEFLIQWPTTGGSPYERLIQIVSRVPTAIEQLTSEVNARSV